MPLLSSDYNANLGSFVMLKGLPTSGKEQRASEPILLSDGSWKPIGVLSQEDPLASIDGDPSVVEGVFPQGIKPVWRVHLSDGISVDCGREHRWVVWCKAWSGGKTREVSTETLKVISEMDGYRGRIKVPLISGRLGGGPVALDPYVLGVLLGDGCLVGNTPMFTLPEKEVAEEIEKGLPAGDELRSRATKDRCSTWSIVGGQTQKALVSLGLAGKRSWEKFIPEECLRWSYEDRKELLRGLLHSDGYVEGHGGIRYATSSEDLKDGIVCLIRSLGGIAKAKERVPHYTYRGKRLKGRPAWIITIEVWEWVESMLTLPRHKRIAERKWHRPPTRTVVSVEPLNETDEMVCIKVSHPSGLYITRGNDANPGYVPTHNTSLVGALAKETDPITGKPYEVFFVDLDRQLQPVLDLLSPEELSRIHYTQPGSECKLDPLTGVMVPEDASQLWARMDLLSQSWYEFETQTPGDLPYGDWESNRVLCIDSFRSLSIAAFWKAQQAQPKFSKIHKDSLGDRNAYVGPGRFKDIQDWGRAADAAMDLILTYHSKKVRKYHLIINFHVAPLSVQIDNQWTEEEMVDAVKKRKGVKGDEKAKPLQLAQTFKLFPIGVGSKQTFQIESPFSYVLAVERGEDGISLLTRPTERHNVRVPDALGKLDPRIKGSNALAKILQYHATLGT